VRILYVCHRFPFPPARGGKIRPFNMIRHLGTRHEVVVVSLVRSQEEARAGEGLAAHCASYRMCRVGAGAAALRMLLRLPTAVPSSMGYFHSPEAARAVREELARRPVDLVFVHCSSVAPYVEDVRGPRKILDFGDMDSQKWLAYAEERPFPLSLGYRLEGIKMRRAEARLAARFDTCTCTTRAELETLEAYGVARRTAWFPNGVDAEYFRPTEEPYAPGSISFVGRMDYYPNQECMFDFCRNVLPLVRVRRPDTTLRIVGANPSPAVRRLQAIAGVTVTGTVPDVRPLVRGTAVNVAPLNIARGTQNKILEAMAMGVPVVASAVAAGGVDAVPGRHLLTASTPEEYADAIVRLLDDPDERGRVAEAGRARVISHHSWEHSMEEMDRIIEDCLRDPGGAAAGTRQPARAAGGRGATR
jgi:sugar transferase (PEP-CTERM/EpsH1 system associated)